MAKHPRCPACDVLRLCGLTIFSCYSIL